MSICMDAPDGTARHPRKRTARSQRTDHAHGCRTGTRTAAARVGTAWGKSRAQSGKNARRVYAAVPPTQVFDPPLGWARPAPGSGHAARRFALHQPCDRPCPGKVEPCTSPAIGYAAALLGHAAALHGTALPCLCPAPALCCIASAVLLPSDASRRTVFQAEQCLGTRAIPLPGAARAAEACEGADVRAPGGSGGVPGPRGQEWVGGRPGRQHRAARAGRRVEHVGRDTMSTAADRTARRIARVPGGDRGRPGR